MAEHVDKLLREQHPSAMNYDCEDSILEKWIQSAPSKNQMWSTNRCLCDCLKSDMLAWYHFYYNQNGYLDLMTDASESSDARPSARARDVSAAWCHLCDNQYGYLNMDGRCIGA